MKRLLLILLAFGSLLALFFVLVRLRNTLGIGVNMKRAAVETAPELKQCRERLVLFHQAWSRYRAKHGGTDPASVAELIPAYVKSTDLLLCPTAERMAARGRTLAQGKVRVGGVEAPLSYEFHWSYGPSPGGAGAASAPLVICPVHHELFARYVFLKDASTFVIPPNLEAQIEALGSTSRLVAVRRDGTLTTLDSR